MHFGSADALDDDDDDGSGGGDCGNGRFLQLFQPNCLLLPLPGDHQLLLQLFS